MSQTSACAVRPVARSMPARNRMRMSLDRKVDEAGLDEPSPEKMRSFFPTVGSVLMMAGSHEMMHTGQIAAIRRKLGKPVVI